MTRKPLRSLGAVLALVMLLSSCATSTPVTIIETVVVERTVEVERSAEVTPQVDSTVDQEVRTDPSTLVVCMGEEPNSLYMYGNPNLAATNIQEAVYDGPLDNRTFGYQPVILKKLPSLDDGDAVIRPVTVQAGDIVVDANNTPVELTEGMQVRSAGCRSNDCAIAFDGVPIEMDQMVVTFELLEGLLWSNGDPLTADDSVYGFELNADPDTPTSRYSVERTTSYEATSATVVVWTGLPGYFDELYYTNFWQPFPRSLWQDELGYSASDLLDAEESARRPMGWGPFVITQWVAGDHITVEKNPNYFRAGEGLPHLDTIIFHFIPDGNEALAKLISGECDVVSQVASLTDQAELLLKLEQEAVVEPIFTTTAMWEHVDFGINPAPDYDRPDFFEDVRVRQAIAMCLDRQGAVDTILHGRSVTIDSYIPPTHPLYAEGLTTWSHDPEAGVALLEEVGWVDADGDGVREASDIEGIANGTQLEFTWHTTTTPLQEQYAQIFQQNLADCGIKVNLEHLPTADYYADGPNGPLFGRRFDMASFAWFTDVLPPCYLYMQAEIPTDENDWTGVNHTGFELASYDEQCSRALAALPGSEDYVEGHKESQRIFAEQLPAIPLFLHTKLAAIRTDVEGFITDSTESSDLWNIEAFNTTVP